MNFSSYLPAVFCQIRRFEPFCVPRLLILESCSQYYFDPLPVTPFMIWINCIFTVCWNYDPVYGTLLCLWIIYITPTCACETCFCITLPRKKRLFFSSWCLRLVPHLAALTNTVITTTMKEQYLKYHQLKNAIKAKINI